VRALELYLEQGRHGDPSAASSIRAVGRLVLEEPPALALAAASPPGRRVLTAWLLTSEDWFADPPDAPRHDKDLDARLTAVRNAPGSPREAADAAALLAWLAYRNGRFDAAAHWVTLAPPDDPRRTWVKAKLALKAGRIERGIHLLRQVARKLPGAGWAGPGDRYGVQDSGEWEATTPPAYRAQADLGLLALSRREFVEALDRLLRAGYWLDAAWVGERVLTVAELQAWVDRNTKPQAALPKPKVDPAASTAPIATADGVPAPEAGSWLADARDLLARRLMRLGRHADAARYLAHHTAEQRQLAQGPATGRHPRKPVRDRAMGLWRAAQVTRTLGMELLGMETEPDWAHADGGFPFCPVLSDRAVDHGVASVSTAETARARATAPRPDKRFHYRHVAADLALEASNLLPAGVPPPRARRCSAGRRTGCIRASA
jgi:hypothetical protein